MKRITFTGREARLFVIELRGSHFSMKKQINTSEIDKWIVFNSLYSIAVDTVTQERRSIMLCVLM